jgi:glucose-1-phosphate adenylyltransferase
MGIYIFDASFLYEQLLDDAERADSTHDFGKDLIPFLVNSGAEVYAHDFHGSCVNMTNGARTGATSVPWMRTTRRTSILRRSRPSSTSTTTTGRCGTYQEQIPPAKFVFDDPDRRGAAIDSLVSGGCIVSGSHVRRSILFTNVRVHNHCLVEDSVVLPGAEIGPSAVVKNAIIDKRCRIPEGMTIGIDPLADARRFEVTEKGRVLVVPEMLERLERQATRSDGITTGEFPTLAGVVPPLHRQSSSRARHPPRWPGTQAHRFQTARSRFSSLE